MRVLSYILLALGIFLLASAGYDEFRGVTHKPADLLRRRHASYSGYLYRIPIVRDNSPGLFQAAIKTHWIYLAVVLVAGVILFPIDNRPNGP